MKVSCIIPAHNEGPRIGDVLRVACNHNLVSEVIVIDDGSEDNTKVIAKKFKKVRLIINEKNLGKSKSVIAGIRRSRGNVLLFLDADLVGLNRKNVADLIEPVINGAADITISLRKNALLVFKLIGMDFVSGERVFYKNLVEEHLEEIEKLPKFGIESYLNKLIIANKLKIKVVPWKNVISPRKYKKEGLLSGIAGDFLMILDIIKTISIWGIAYQMVKMFLLKVR